MDWDLEEHMLKLEQSQVDITRDIESKQDEAQRAGRRLTEARGELERIQRALEDVQTRIQRFRHEYKVVLLSEYEQCLKQRNMNEELLVERRQEINKLFASGQKASKQIPVLQAQLRQVEAELARVNAELAGVGKVLEFRR
jgi:chromosome segregation ATPase